MQAFSIESNGPKNRENKYTNKYLHTYTGLYPIAFFLNTSALGYFLLKKKKPGKKIEMRTILCTIQTKFKFSE